MHTVCTLTSTHCTHRAVQVSCSSIPVSETWTPSPILLITYNYYQSKHEGLIYVRCMFPPRGSFPPRDSVAVSQHSVLLALQQHSVLLHSTVLFSNRSINREGNSPCRELLLPSCHYQYLHPSRFTRVHFLVFLMAMTQ